ncbi:ATP-binding cassette domain-containing protein [Burkholderia multivorans]|nr:ATP-binding cassette domain-containing protein [Burkholderia multivorans]VWB64456.1 ABC transporter ATP-binding protein [Burkholderia ubonensis]
MSCDDAILQVRDVSKVFHIYDAPVDRLKQSIMSRLWKGRVGDRSYHKEFWALKGVDFDVARGETVGVIGRNGAGKSTLLQIICGTLLPTHGHVTARGKISALLELGAGFNPEFTGRDNVMLSGAILGLEREEILSKFDDIAAFADIGQFIDQPVKTYSSGMYVRLAFSVACHVEPELLIVDEALAVGDSVFQAKCMNRIRRMMDDGLSLLFVSHDISAVKSLCSKAVLLEQGQMVAFADTAHVANLYTGIVHEKKAQDETGFEKTAAIERVGDGAATYLSVETVDEYGRPKETFEHGQDVYVVASFKMNVDISMVGIGIHVRDRTGADVAYLDNLLESQFLTNVKAGEVYKAKWRIPCAFVRGRYDIAAVVSRPGPDADPMSQIAEDYVIADFVAVATQFGVIGEWNIYGNLRFGALEEIQFLTQETEEDNVLALDVPPKVLTDVDPGMSPLMLHIACGHNVIPGWINIDAYGGADVYRWDLAKGLPFPDGSVDYIFTEHFIEHLPKASGLAFLGEARRVLKPGGILRLSTPSLEYLVSRYAEGKLDEWADVGWVVQEGADLINESLRNWGHQYMYDAAALSSAMKQAGFVNISVVPWRESDHVSLKGLECRPFHQDLIFEGSK